MEDWEKQFGVLQNINFKKNGDERKFTPIVDLPLEDLPSEEDTNLFNNDQIDNIQKAVSGIVTFYNDIDKKMENEEKDEMLVPCMNLIVEIKSMHREEIPCFNLFDDILELDT